MIVMNGNAYETLGGGSGGYGELLQVDLKSGHQTLLYSFTGDTDGSDPIWPLTYQDGAFYGTTFYGGKFESCFDDQSCGTVFNDIIVHLLGQQQCLGTVVTGNVSHAGY
jgi:hypothetical protein